jgi:GT2 family glycosyltransferase
VLDQTREIAFEVLVVDNGSTDGSAEAIESRFPQVRLFAVNSNLGFAAANNVAATRATGEWLLMLNPDTVVLDGGIDKLIAFARQHPAHGIYGGRTLFQDRTLNPTSCWRRITLWSMLCYAMGLSSLFRRNWLLDPESMGRWPRHSVREVDIVTGCFLLISRGLWDRLGGLDPAFFMYGEEADLCMRARASGARPILCPSAVIIHHGGRSESCATEKLVRILRARRRLICRHWRPALVPVGTALQDLAILIRVIGSRVMAGMGGPKMLERNLSLRQAWSQRELWRKV